MATNSPLLPFDSGPVAAGDMLTRDRAARERAVDPRLSIALEASAGTGKTRVLVDRYINLLREGVDPANILAMTFTRKAASEMRDRIMTTLRNAAATGEIAPARWRELRDRTADIGISTIDAFCLSLLREFPLEADLDPGFDVADETELPRFIGESLDRTLRIGRSLALDDENVSLVFAQLGEKRLRSGLSLLLSRRLVASSVLARATSHGSADVVTAIARVTADLIGVFDGMPGGLDRFLESGPPEPQFLLLHRSLRQLRPDGPEPPGMAAPGIQVVLSRVRDYFLTQDGQPRTRVLFPKAAFASETDWQVHRTLVTTHAARIAAVLQKYRADLNVVVSRGVRRMFAVAGSEYRRTLDAHAALDFSDLLLRALDLLRRMEEFSQSRYRLESRYHHVLVDEFQDTSRAQWELVALLTQAWGEGAGLAHSGPLPPSIFIVGDRKQSIYGFRDADVSMLREASRFLEGLRPGAPVRQAISHSFRAVPALLSFVNDLCHDMDKAPARKDAFEYGESDRFPVDDATGDGQALGLIAAETPEECAAIAASEIARLISAGETVRDRDTGLHRPVRAADIAVLFRTRESHREFEAALEARGIPAYVYKGLGFFDADEIKDVLALLRYLADPLSDLHAAAFLRSRFIGLSDDGLQRLAPHVANALRSRTGPDGTEPDGSGRPSGLPEAAQCLDDIDQRILADARAGTLRWRGLVDRLQPAELLDLVLSETAYGIELRGLRFPQARENLKKVRAIVRRIQNRGYTTLGRIAAHLDRLAVGDEANAVIDVANAVHLMTVHAAKGLEFPVVFVVNLARGTGNRRDPIRLGSDVDEAGAVAVGDFQSATDDDVLAREREETKRLVYVALTRARDRLYLGSPIKDGRIQPGRGSLAEVFPPALLELFSPGTQDGERAWCASTRNVHRVRVCQKDSAEDQAHALKDERVPGQPERIADDFGPLDASGPSPVHRDYEEPAAAVGHEGLSTDGLRLAGTVVHRLLHRRGFDAQADVVELRTAITGMIPEHDAAGPFVEVVIAAYRAMSAHPEVQALYAFERWHEVPFTMEHEGSLVRGRIDCLVKHGEGHFTVLEFKTGSPRDGHAAQLELYRRAAAQVFPDAVVDARLVYARDVERS